MASKMNKAAKAAAIQAYELAYERANPGKRIRVKESSPGWYVLVDGYGKSRNKYRLGALVEMTDRLEDRGRFMVAAEGAPTLYLTERETWVSTMMMGSAKVFTSRSEAEKVAEDKRAVVPTRRIYVHTL